MLGLLALARTAVLEETASYLASLQSHYSLSYPWSLLAEAEAVETAKKELGENVVVMNVKNVKRKGFFDFLKPHMVEVTIALEEENANRADAASVDMKAAVSATPHFPALSYRGAS